jgi:hypothetical protein
MALEGLDLRDIVLLFLGELLDLELGATHVLFHVHVLLIQLVVILCKLLYRLLVSLRLHAGVPVVLQHVLFLHLQSPHALLGKSLLVLELFVLPLQEVIRLSGLGELVVDKFVLPGKGLDILGQLSGLGCLNLYDLILVLYLLPEVLILLSQQLNFIFSLE